jgi:hypothetical protein
MPNRIVREGILSSEKVASLSWEEEVFYRRLMSVVDDHGRTEANAKWLRSRCYPLQVDSMSADDVKRLLQACEATGLVIVYKVGNKKFLQIDNFQQQRRATSKYPPPPENESRSQPSAKQLKSNDIKCSQMISDAKQMIANDINCSQMIANAHLDGDVVGVVFEDVVEKEVLSVQPSNQNSASSNSVPDKPEQTASVLEKSVTQKRSPRLADDEFLAELRETGAYDGIDLDAELRKMHAWLLTPKGRGRKLTRQFAVNWLNKVDRPLRLVSNLERSPPKRAKL